MAGVRLPPAFQMPDESGCRGGVELGFLSTSSERDQARSPAQRLPCGARRSRAIR
jgi:hypothetical protein